MKCSEASQKADVTRQTIRRWINSGKIDAKKKGKAWSVDKESLKNFLEERESKSKKDKKEKEDNNMCASYRDLMQCRYSYLERLFSRDLL